MGVTFVKMNVANPADPSRAIEEQFLVDSGAVYALVPRSELEQIGVAPDSADRHRARFPSQLHPRQRRSLGTGDQNRHLRISGTARGLSGHFRETGRRDDLEDFGLILDEQALRLLAAEMKQRLLPSELVSVSRIVLLDSSDANVRSITSEHSIENGRLEIDEGSHYGFPAERGFVITARAAA